jgi:uncharacterized protein YndB with AHSA1/START domain
MLKIDILGYINAVARTVSTGEHDGRSARVIVAACTYDTTIEDLWDAITNKERIPRWFVPVSGDLRQGGRFQVEGNASGQILVCKQPHRLEVTWEFGGEVSWLELRLKEKAQGRTRLELEHTARVDDERWSTFGPGAVGVGWDLGLLGLRLHVPTGAVLKKEEVFAWQVSAEGKEYVRRCSEEWCKASVSSGTPEAAARAAADRTTAFYTGATAP